MSGSVLVRIWIFVLLPVMLGGCGISSFSDFLTNEKSCSTGSKFEQATCLAYEYRDICQAGEFGLRSNLNRLRKINKNDIGTRICKKQIAITIGPVIAGTSITGTLAEQSAKKETQCDQAGSRDKVLCAARVQLKFLSRQFKAACLATIPWYTANDLMFNTIEIRERVLANAKIDGNEIYSTDRKWLCHKNTSVSGLDLPQLKQVYSEPENKILHVLLAQAEKECPSAGQTATPLISTMQGKPTTQARTTNQNLACILPRTIKNMGLQFSTICKQKSSTEEKDTALAELVHARKFLAMLHPDQFRNSNFVWLCGKKSVYVKSRMVIAKAETATTETASSAKTPLIAKRKLRKNNRWKAQRNRLRFVKAVRRKQTKAVRTQRASFNPFSSLNPSF